MSGTRRHSCSNPGSHCHEKLYTVTVVGAAGGIGQPLSLLLKSNAHIGRLNLFDVAPSVTGVAMDISHVDTPAIVHGYSGKDKLADALKGSDVVVSVAGVTLKPGQSRDDLFSINCSILKGIASGIADHCPQALVAVVSNPVNSLVPLVLEVMLAKGVKEAEKRVFGVSTLDVMRASVFASQLLNVSASDVKMPVIGAHSGPTIIPVASRCEPQLVFSKTDDLNAFHTRVQSAGHEVLTAKEGKGTATLSMAYAAARFTTSLLRALSGHDVVECAFVKSHVTSASFFSNELLLGRHGVKRNLGLGPLAPDEEARVAACLRELKQQIAKGEQAARAP